MRLGRDERWPLCSGSGRIKDPGDAIRFGQEGAIHDGESGADAEADEAAGNVVGLGEEGERHEEAEHDATQQDEGQLPTAGLHDRCVNMLDQGSNDERGQQDAGDRRDAGNDGINAVPPHVVLGQLVASRLLTVRPPAVHALLAIELVQHVLLIPARITDPAAVITLLHDLDLSQLAGMRTHGLGSHDGSLVEQDVRLVERKTVIKPDTDFGVSIRVCLGDH